MKNTYTKTKLCAAAILTVLLLGGCSADDKPEVQPETEFTAPITMVEKEEKLTFRPGYTYSGLQRPAVIDDGGQLLPEEGVAEAEDGRIIYTVNSRSAGMVEGNVSQPGGIESNEVTAVPNLGYKFIKWSDGNTNPTRSGDTGEGLYTAIFDYDILDMPIMVINTNDGGEIKSKTEYVDGTISLYGCRDKYRLDNMPLQIRGRGNNSWTYPKKSYKMKLSEKTNLFGLADGKEKVWVILANQCDQSLQRNQVSFEYGRYMDGIDWEPASTSVEVYLNGEYVGVYLLAEDIKVSNDRVDIEEDKIDELDTGYLLELSNYSTGDVINAAGRAYMIHSDLSEDRNTSRKQKSFISDYVNDAYEALSSGDRAAFEELVDLDSFIDSYLTEEIVKNLDSQWDSFYLYKDAGKKLFFGPVWDFDLALGNANEGEEYTDQIFVGNGSGSGGGFNTWFAVAMLQEWFRQEIQDRWNAMYEDLCVMPEYILEEGKTGLRSYERNFERWQIFGTVQNRETEFITSLKNYTEHYEYLASWLTQRLEWLNGAFNDEKFVPEGEGLYYFYYMKMWENGGQRQSSYADDKTEEIAGKYENLTRYIRESSVEAPDGFDGEGPENLFDSDKETKYCVEMDGELDVTFKMKKAITLEAYLLRTANDTAEFPERNPDSWTIYGSTDGENWTEITSVDKDGNTLGAENKIWYGFEVENDTAYSYYKIHFKNNGIMQLSEFRLLGSR